MNLPQLQAAGSCQSTGEVPALSQAFDVVRQGPTKVVRDGRRLTVCHKDELPPGQKKIITEGKWSAGVYNIAGSYYAIKNVCPHAGAPLCKGTVHATHQPSDVGEFDPAYHGRILRCPWHGWEFDIPTGKGLYDRKSRVATYPVVVDEQGMVVVIR